MKRSPEKNIAQFEWVVAKSLSTIVKSLRKNCYFRQSTCGCGGEVIANFAIHRRKNGKSLQKIIKKIFWFLTQIAEENVDFCHWVVENHKFYLKNAQKCEYRLTILNEEISCLVKCSQKKNTVNLVRSREFDRAKMKNFGRDMYIIWRKDVGKKS